MFDQFTVTISNDGRSGYVFYSEGLLRKHSFYWEFAGGDVVVSINVPSPVTWTAALPWAAGRRDEVLQRVAEELRRQQCPSCDPRIGDQWIEMVQQA